MTDAEMRDVYIKAGSPVDFDARSHVAGLRAVAAAARREVEDEYKADADRWRLARKWFRVMSPHIDGNHVWCPTGEWGRSKGPTIDAVVDSAIRARAGEA